MSNQPSNVVFEFEAGRRGTVRASVSHYKGKVYADLRLWVEPRESPGAELIPTSKGLSLPIEFADEMREAADALANAAKASTRPSARRTAA